MSESNVHPASLDAELLVKACDERAVRRSGPGGQHRNKVETAVLIRHRETGIQAEASERRSRAENRRVALSRLRVNLALEVRCEHATGADPSELWRSRCRNRRISASRHHPDFPSLLAEALDAVFRSQMDLKQAAGWLDCTVSQLTKFLKLEPRALALVNDRRHSIGLHRIK